MPLRRSGNSRAGKLLLRFDHLVDLVFGRAAAHEFVDQHVLKSARFGTRGQSLGFPQLGSTIDRNE
jgi:hypothetical protein